MCIIIRLIAYFVTRAIESFIQDDLFLFFFSVIKKCFCKHFSTTKLFSRASLADKILVQRLQEHVALGKTVDCGAYDILFVEMC